MLEGIDLTVIGTMNYLEGEGRISIGLIDLLKDDFSLNFIPVNKFSLLNLTNEVRNIATNPDKTPGSVCILTSTPSWSSNLEEMKQTLPKSDIKIAYAMFESTRVPAEWVKFFNDNFDAIVVPDPCLVEYYKNSGTVLPIFVLPLGMYLDEFLNKPSPISPHNPFTFGISAAGICRKNVPLAIRAFAEEFGNSKDVILKIHDRFGIPIYQDLIRNVNISNIIINLKALNQKEYFDLMLSYDCYINISKSEGYSCCPREFLALGIPCILSNNTAHQTLCKTNYVKSVPSLIVEPADYGDGTSSMIRSDWGNQFNCDIMDVRAALREVYKNYAYYLGQAKLGKKWVSKYSWSNLKSKYSNLVKPKLVIYGNKNIISDNYLMTDNLGLYKKYKKAGNRFSVGDPIKIL